MDLCPPYILCKDFTRMRSTCKTNDLKHLLLLWMPTDAISTFIQESELFSNNWTVEMRHLLLNASLNWVPWLKLGLLCVASMHRFVTFSYSSSHVSRSSVSACMCADLCVYEASLYSTRVLLNLAAFSSIKLTFDVVFLNAHQTHSTSPHPFLQPYTTTRYISTLTSQGHRSGMLNLDLGNNTLYSISSHWMQAKLDLQFNSAVQSFTTPIKSGNDEKLDLVKRNPHTFWQKTSTGPVWMDTELLFPDNNIE